LFRDALEDPGAVQTGQNRVSFLRFVLPAEDDERGFEVSFRLVAKIRPGLRADQGVRRRFEPPGGRPAASPAFHGQFADHLCLGVDLQASFLDAAARPSPLADGVDDSGLRQRGGVGGFPGQLEIVQQLIQERFELHGQRVA